MMKESMKNKGRVEELDSEELHAVYGGRKGMLIVRLTPTGEVISIGVVWE
jgi:hypothetical protein